MYRALKKLIPVQVKDIIKYIIKAPRSILVDSYPSALDAYRSLAGMTPPRSMIFVGGGDFTAIGDEFKKYFVQLADLQPDAKVLDVGCGIGRMAVPLTGYLSAKGEYWGFDIVNSGVEWCQRRISRRFKNFHFQHSDVLNSCYNPTGRIQSRDYKFPFQDQTFDFVFLTSVFTHMLPDDLENYLSEIARVLKNDGKSLITFFLLNDESKALVSTGSSTFDFRYQLEGCVTIDKAMPEKAIAYDENVIFDLYEKYGLVPSRPVQYGSWCGRKSFLSFQDIVISVKRPT